MLSEDFEKELYNFIEDKIKTKNAAVLFYFSRLFNSLFISKQSLLLIERCFQIIVDNSSFLQLDFNCILKIISSSQLNTDSELEVFNAVVSWLEIDKQRIIYAKNLFLKIRLSLLSVPAIKFISGKISCFIDNLAFVNKIIENKSKGLHMRNLKDVSRYCNQEKFNIFVCGGEKKGVLVRDVYSIKANNFTSVRNVTQLKYGRKWSKLTSVKDDIFLVGGKNNTFKCITSIKKYSIVDSTWEIVAYMPDERIDFSVCSFMGNVYVLGGCLGRDVKSCFQFKPAGFSWTEIAEMNEERCSSSCAVFQGKIVVTGGFNNTTLLPLKTVEAYDHVANKWTYMPDMVKVRLFHNSVAIKNKLFIVNYSCEVYDSVSDKFVLLKLPPKCSIENLSRSFKVISINNKIAVFPFNSNIVLLYDVKSNDWSQESCEVTRNISGFSCLKVPQF